MLIKQNKQTHNRQLSTDVLFKQFPIVSNIIDLAKTFDQR